jgi:hypothetical protein
MELPREMSATLSEGASRPRRRVHTPFERAPKLKISIQVLPRMA